MGIKSILRVALGSSLILSACNYQAFDLIELPNIEVPAVGPISGKTEASFQSIYKTVIEAKCLKCHVPGGKAKKVPLDSYENILKTLVPGEPEKSNLYKSVLPDTRRRMPPVQSGIPPLDNEQIEALRVWIASGAPERIVLPEVNLTFDLVLENIIKPKCLSCHELGGDAQLVVLDVHDVLTGNFGTVIPGDAENSIFYKVIQPDMGEERMPPIRSGAEALTEAERELIRIWIEAGAVK